MKRLTDEFIDLFCKVWNESETVDIAADKLGLTRQRTRGLSSTMRRKGLKLKKYSTVAIKNAKRKTDPTLDEIKARAEEIRKSW
jgi:hypothetical protein